MHQTVALLGVRRHNFPGVTMFLYGAPTRPGWVRVIMTMTGPPGSGQGRPATPQLNPLLNAVIDFTDSIPWLQHAVNRNAILDGDGYFLHAAVSAAGLVHSAYI
jgi:Pheophorbide a oxygenase